MIPYKSPMLTAVPRTLEKQLDILGAIDALMAQDGDDKLRKRRKEIAALRRGLQDIALTVAELRRACDPRLRSNVIKYSPYQPRVPAGNPDGGQWTTGGTGGFAADADNADDISGDIADTDDEAGLSGSSNIQVAAAGGLRCDGFSGGCESGGTYGTTAMYKIYGRNLCWDCAVKILDLQDASSSEKVLRLSPYVIER